MAIRFSDLLLEVWQDGIKKTISPWKLSLIVSLAVTACLALLNSTGCFQILEWVIFDQYFRLRSAEETDSRLLIITIDEPDIARLQQWPLSDENLAKVLTQVDRYDPRVIGLDIYRDFPIPPGTAALEKVFRNTPNLIGVEKLGNTPVESSPILAEQDQVAMADIVMDNDGTVRRALLSARVGNEVRYTLGAALALQYLRKEEITLETVSSSNLSRLGAVKFPPLQSNDGAYVNADIRGHQLLLNFRGPDNAFDVISITDVLEGRLPEELVRDRIILIGSIAPSLNDFVYTPYNTSTITQTTQSPGVTIHAHIASQILSAVLDGRSLIQTWPTSAEWGWTFLWCSLGSGIILIPIWRGHNSLISLVSTGIPILSLSAALMMINGLWFLNGWWIPSIPAALGLIISATVSLTAKNSKLVKDAYIDGLTNLLNRRAFNQQIIEAQKQPKELAIILCDIDYFKDFNDFYGHPAGDSCLRQVAQAIQQAVRSQDLVARYGGEEFAVILQNISNEKAYEIAQRMLGKVQSCQIPHAASKVSSYVSISCGVATRLSSSKSPLSQILLRADQALYKAKRAGRNRVELSEQSESAVDTFGI